MKRPRIALFVLGLAISSAAAASEHRYILRADLSGPSCPAELVLAEATGCTSKEMANELVKELVEEGFDATGVNAAGCQPAAGSPTEYICWYHVPHDCTVERTSITVEVGSSCGGGIAVTGRDFGMAVGFHFFAIDAQATL